MKLLILRALCPLHKFISDTKSLGVTNYTMTVITVTSQCSLYVLFLVENVLY